MYKKSFSLIELIFMIVVMGIIASVALPKFMDTRNDAIVSSLKQDITTITTSIQSYYLLNGKIDKISDCVTLNSATWDISDTEIKYLENKKTCIDIKIEDSKLKVTIDNTTGTICQELTNQGISTISYSL
ncbi:putative transformation system protein [hydrothermal vent metagenome]|uniref:Putative transformation system protein n=1 Tax=hydrothermal vent metagenome TaxID=652676 RepID=A0A3B1E5Y9_9ZZZZ